MHTRTPKRFPILAIFTSAVYGTVVATGVLAIGFVATAAFKGYSPIDLYAETFPVSRGPAGGSLIPPLVYAIFFLYVIGAAEVAIACRRRLSRR